MTVAEKWAVLGCFIFTWVAVGLLYVRMDRAESIVRGMLGGWKRGR